MMEGALVQRYEVTDDRGYLAVVDPDAYETFVSHDWDDDQIRAHFLEQMRRERILVWCSGMEETWDVEVTHGRTNRRGFREAEGPIRCTRGRLLFTSFDSLSMAAQFADVTLPEAHERDQVLELPIGEYRCRVVQTHDPGLWVADRKASGEPDFVLELTHGAEQLPIWAAIPWDRFGSRGIHATGDASSSQGQRAPSNVSTATLRATWAASTARRK